MQELEFSVLLFASLKDVVQLDHILVRVPATPEAPVTVADLLAQCGRQYPALARWLPYVKVAVNCTYAGPRQVLAAADEIALLPPVSGGCNRVPVDGCRQAVGGNGDGTGFKLAS